LKKYKSILFALAVSGCAAESDEKLLRGSVIGVGTAMLAAAVGAPALSAVGGGMITGGIFAR
jgi:hypothetical protein